IAGTIVYAFCVAAFGTMVGARIPNQAAAVQVVAHGDFLCEPARMKGPPVSPAPRQGETESARGYFSWVPLPASESQTSRGRSGPKGPGPRPVVIRGVGCRAEPSGDTKRCGWSVWTKAATSSAGRTKGRASTPRAGKRSRFDIVSKATRVR